MFCMSDTSITSDSTGSIGTCLKCLIFLNLFFWSVVIDFLYLDRLTGLLRRVPAEIAAAVEPQITYIGGNYKLVDMTRLYQCADAYVAPYLSEAFCLPVMEAAACGLPAICTQGGPTEEFTSDEFALRIGAGWDPTTRTLAPDVTHLAQNMTFLLLASPARHFQWLAKEKAFLILVVRCFMIFGK